MPTKINVTHHGSHVRLVIDDTNDTPDCPHCGATREARPPVDVPILQALMLCAGMTGEVIGRLHIAQRAPTDPPPALDIGRPNGQAEGNGGPAVPPTPTLPEINPSPKRAGKNKAR